MLRDRLYDPETVAAYRTGPKDWTRHRRLPFVLVVLLILQGKKHSLQNTLNRLFTALAAVFEVPTASALCQARRKLQPELFLHLNQAITEHFYRLPIQDIALDDPTISDLEEGEEEGGPAVQLRWHGYRVLSVDGTCWTLPDTLANRNEFGKSTNQVDPVGQAQSQGSVLFDVLNDIGLDMTLLPTQSEMQVLQEHHLAYLGEGDLVVLDRGYGSYAVMAGLQSRGCEFVIRQTRHSFRAVRDFWKSAKNEQIVEIEVTPDQKKTVREQGWPMSVRVRLVKVQWSWTDEKGKEHQEKMVVATSLRDASRYPAAEIERLYGWRWRIEGYIDRLKNIFEAERFSSTQAHNMRQDLFGVLFLSTLESLLVKRPWQELEKASQKRAVRRLQVNRSVSYSTLLDHTLILLTDNSRSLDQTLEEIQYLFKTNPVPVRPGRSFSHERKSTAKRLRFHRFGKRLS